MDLMHFNTIMVNWGTWYRYTPLYLGFMISFHLEPLGRIELPYPLYEGGTSPCMFKRHSTGLDGRTRTCMVLAPKEVASFWPTSSLIQFLERVKGVAPLRPGWKPSMLLLNIKPALVN